jgi:hypothetical protein
MLKKKNPTHWSRRKHPDDQYLIDGLTGKYTYYPAGSFPDVEKLAEFNREEEKTYRHHHELYFQKNEDKTETPLCVVAEVDDLEAESEERVQLEIANPHEPKMKAKREENRLLYWAKKCLSPEEYAIFKDVCLQKTVSRVKRAAELGISRKMLQKRIKDIEMRVFQASSGRKNKKIHSMKP